MDGIWQLIMIAAHGTGRFKYTWYRVFPFFKQKIMLFVKSDTHSVYRVSKNEGILFHLLQLPSNVALMNFDEIPFETVVWEWKWDWM